MTAASLRSKSSLKICDTVAFKKMQQGAQNLYFALTGRAADDGYIDSIEAVKKSCNATSEDFQELLSREYLIPFEEGFVVLRYWRTHEITRFYKEVKNGAETARNATQTATAEQVEYLPDELPRTDGRLKINALNEFKKLYAKYPCGIAKSKKQSIELYWKWLNGKTITVMGAKKTVRYNHLQIRFALAKFIEDHDGDDEQFIPRLPTFLGERKLCDYIAATKSEYADYMQDRFGDEWQKVKFVYERGEV